MAHWGARVWLADVCGFDVWGVFGRGCGCGRFGSSSSPSARGRGRDAGGTGTAAVLGLNQMRRSGSRFRAASLSRAVLVVSGPCVGFGVVCCVFSGSVGLCCEAGPLGRCGTVGGTQQQGGGCWLGGVGVGWPAGTCFALLWVRRRGGALGCGRVDARIGDVGSGWGFAPLLLR